MSQYDSYMEGTDIQGTSMERECDEPALGNTRKPNIYGVHGNKENAIKSESFKEEVTRTQHPVLLYGERLVLLSKRASEMHVAPRISCL